MTRNDFLCCLILVVAPPVGAAVTEGPSASLDLLAEIRRLQRVVNELVVARHEERVARCQVEREATVAALDAATVRLRTLESRRSELREERDQAETESSRMDELDEEIASLEREALAPTELTIDELRRSLRLVEARCEFEREVLRTVSGHQREEGATNPRRE